MPLELFAVKIEFIKFKALTINHKYSCYKQ